MRRALAILLCAAFAAGVAPSASAQVLWERTPTGWRMGPIEHLGTVPVEAGSAVGAAIHEGYLYVTTWRSFSIYDIANPARPKLVSISDVGPQLINEGPATNGEILLLSNDAVTGELEVWDVTDKAEPSLLSTVTTPRSDHIWTCVLDCSHAYGSDGSIVDLSDPSQPSVAGDWRTEAPVRLTHTIREVAPGFVLTGSLPMHYLDVREPLAPVRLATVEPPTTRPTRTLPLGAPESVSGHIDWPQDGTDRYALTALETPFSDSCDESSGALVVLDSAGYESTETFGIADTHRITANGTPLFGQSPANVLGCSPLGVDAHPDFRRSRLAAVSWFESGVRLFDVDADGSLTELGGFIADGAESFMTAWASHDILYSIDTARGIDVFRVDVPIGYQRPGSLATVSGAASGASEMPAISGDGRFVAFQSEADDLVAGDGNGATDVFVRDLESGAIERVSVPPGGGDGDGASTVPSISHDGRYVAFQSDATNLAVDDTNEATDVFVHDRQTGETVRASVPAGGGESNGNAFGPSLSADGRHVSFTSLATNLATGDDNEQSDVFVRDLDDGVTEAVSVANDGTFGNPLSLESSISADGSSVAFASFATNLDPGIVPERGGNAHTYVRDRTAGTTERISEAPDGSPGNSYSRKPTISADGSTVAFFSIAINLVPADRNTAIDVFVWDRDTGRLERVSLASDGAEGDTNADWEHPGVSADGRFIAFGSDASNLTSSDTNVRLDAFVHDRLTGATERVSITPENEGSGSSWDPSISADGRLVAFTTNAGDLVAGDGNEAEDVLVRDRGADASILSLEAVPDGGGLAVSGAATLSGAVVSSASDPATDGGPAGAELTGARAIVRPEQEDLVLRMDLTDLPVVRHPDESAISVAGTPGTVFAFAFAVDGTPYEVRVAPVGRAPTATLFRCDGGCIEAGSVAGTIGAGGAEVRASIPLGAVGVRGGESLTGVSARVGPGDTDTGIITELDGVTLPDATVPPVTVELGIAPAGTSPDDVAFDAVADLVDGVFATTLDAAGTSGDDEVWGRVCLGERCALRSTRV